MFSDFGDLDLAEEPTAQDKEERFRRALETSKESYKKELVYTEPKWYDPPDIPAPTRLQVRNIDFYLNSLFLSGKYTEALPLALTQLDFEEDNLGKDGREVQLLDMCIRLALKLNETELAGHLAERGLAKLDVSQQPGLASTCAEGFLVCNRPRRALKCALYSMSIRGKLPIFVDQFRRSLESLRTDPDCDNKALDSIIKVFGTHANMANVVIPEDISVPELLDACLITDSGKERIISLIHQNVPEDTDKHEGRSVKTL